MNTVAVRLVGGPRDDERIALPDLSDLQVFSPIPLDIAGEYQYEWPPGPHMKTGAYTHWMLPDGTFLTDEHGLYLYRWTGFEEEKHEPG